MQIDVLTLFPEFFISPLQTSIIKRSKEKVNFNIVNIRDFTLDKHKKADDKTFGGGCGMVMKAQPIFDAINSLDINKKTKIIMLCPTGETYNQKKAIEFSKEDRLVFICGHYEGIDERVRKHLVTDEVSIGDYVLTGGEVATLTIIDSVIRLIPDVLGNENSAIEDSFSDGLLDCPHYTRPHDYNGYFVPDVLMSGNHSQINEWRLKEKIKITLMKRFDLITKYDFKNISYKFLGNIIDEINNDKELNNIEEFKINFLITKFNELKNNQSRANKKIQLENLNWNNDNKFILEDILNKNSFQNKKVIFDFDNTIISRDLGEYTFLELLKYNLIDINKLRDFSPDFYTDNKNIILGSTVNPLEYYESLMMSTNHQSLDESEIINGYIWLVQAMSGLTLKQIVDINVALSDTKEKENNLKPFFQPEIINLIGNLLINQFKVYIVSATNTWTVRNIVLKQLNPLLNQKFKKDIKISPQNIFGINTLIKDKRDNKLYKDIHLIKSNNRYKNMDLEELNNYTITSQITFPVTTFEGKNTLIEKYILKDNEIPFLIAGDSPNDISMITKSEYKLWIERTEKLHYKKYIENLINDSWIIQKANTINNPGFIKD
jgi:tRNA (guanine37-N1)-methyltransferase